MRTPISLVAIFYNANLVSEFKVIFPVNSRNEWNLEYLLELFSDPANRKNKRIIVAPRIVTFSPANPPYKRWISEEISILHKDEKMKKTFPFINVVSRQNKNIRRRIMRNRFREDDGLDEQQPV